MFLYVILSQKVIWKKMREICFREIRIKMLKKDSKGKIEKIDKRIAN